MAGISTPGVGSGLDINSIISQLMQLERRPLVALQRKESFYEDQISAYGKIKSALSTFRDKVNDLDQLSDFNKYSAATSDDTVLTASADSNAVAGSYDIVVNNLATSHKLVSEALTDTDSTFDNGTGTLTIGVGGNTFDVAIDGTNNTLSGIRDAINGASDNTGVTATIVTDVSGARLILTSDEEGTANQISVDVADDVTNSFDTTGLSRLAYTANPPASYNMTEQVAAEDASLTIDGLTVTSSSNQVTGAIEGVTIDLLQDGGATGTLTISQDKEGIKESVQAFVDAYNEVVKALGKEGDGSLAGDSTLRSIETAMRGVLNTPATGVTGAFSYLAEVGVRTKKDGTLEIDSDSLDSAMTNDVNGIAQLFANDPNGVMYRMDSMLDDWIQAGGLLQNRTDGIGDRVSALESRMDIVEERLDRTEERYRRQFSSLDAMLGQMQSTSNWLASQLSSL